MQIANLHQRFEHYCAYPEEPGAAGGALVGASFWTGEQIYDGMNFVLDRTIRFHNDVDNAIIDISV